MLLALRSQFESRPGTVAAHVANWADVPWVVVAHQGIYQHLVPITVAHTGRFSAPVSAQQISHWAVNAHDRVRQSWIGRSSLVLSSHHRSRYGKAASVSVAHQGLFDHRFQRRVSHRAAWTNTSPVASQHQGRHRLLLLNPVARQHQSLWSLPQAQVRRITGQPVLRHLGKSVELLEARISADEDSAVWLADLTLARIEDFERMAIGDEINLDLYGEVFSLVVDAKRLSRPEPARLDLQISAISPVAAAVQPVTRQWAGPVNARLAVEELLGPIDWRLPEWDIPAGTLAAGGETPLSVARRIAAVVGGLIESAPDGNLIARQRHPVSPPDYGFANIDHVLTEADLIQVETRLEPKTLQDRFVIHFGAEASVSDRVEFVRDASDLQTGIVRIYPSPWRSVTLAHTGDEAVIITPLGEVSREESELVEFRDGTGETSYPVTRINDFRWQYVDLGAVTFTPDATRITSVVAGYSLLQLRYATRSIEYRVSDPRIEEIQFLVLEDDTP